jgi:hypothetical protein
MAKKKQPAPEENTDPLELSEELEEFTPELQIRRRKSNAGRPPKYRSEYATIAGVMLRRGATVNELAEAFGVTNATVYYWKTKHIEFFEQFTGISEGALERTVQSLVDRANGYTYETVKVFNYKGVPVIVPVKEHVPPDIGAIKYLLTAKRPADWRIKEEVELTGNEAFAEIFRKMGEKKKDDS